MNEVPLRVLYRGTEEPHHETRELQAGPLTLVLEDGALRAIRWGAREVLRAVYVAVRDPRWSNVPATISDLRIASADGGFDVSFRAEHQRGPLRFAWRGTIRGDAKGTIVFTMDGEAGETFLKNRIGICVLHPIRECAGQPCLLERGSGAVTRGSFPRYIWAQQPFTDIRAISHEVAPGVRARVAFEGDVFEMEDQRNWGDASYKIYSTPLALPFPAELKKGAKIRQVVTLSVEAPATAAASPVATPISVGSVPLCPLPKLGLGVASHGRPLTPGEIAELRVLRPAHLRVDLRPAAKDVEARLRQACVEARALGARLEIALHLGAAADQEVKELIPLLSRIDPPLATWLVFDAGQKTSSQRVLLAARETLIPYHPDVLVGAGSDAWFADINRAQLPKDLELLCYSLNPQVHLSDDRTLIENLEGLESTIESGRLLVKNHPIAISPVTLRPRFNPDAAGPEPEPPPGELPARIDSRQMSLFGAAWTLGSLKALSKPGVHSLTYYETTGRLGVMEREKDVPLHPRFPALPGWVFPLYHVLADVGEFAGAGVLPWTSGSEQRVEGLGLTRDGKTRILLANLTSKPQKIRLSCPLLKDEVLVKRLDETNVMAAMTMADSFRRDPGDRKSGRPLELELLPYALVRVDSSQ